MADTAVIVSAVLCMAEEFQTLNLAPELARIIPPQELSRAGLSPVASRQWGATDDLQILSPLASIVMRLAPLPGQVFAGTLARPSGA
jgi:hypothetical protein